MVGTWGMAKEIKDLDPGIKGLTMWLDKWDRIAESRSYRNLVLDLWYQWRLLLLLLLLSRFSHVRLCVTPETAAHQASPSLGFSRQEHWSGLPFPSPMHESEKWKWSRSVVSDSSRPHGLQPTAYQAPPSMGFSRQEYWSGVPWRLRVQNYSKLVWSSSYRREWTCVGLWIIRKIWMGPAEVGRHFLWKI